MNLKKIVNSLAKNKSLFSSLTKAMDTSLFFVTKGDNYSFEVRSEIKISDSLNLHSTTLINYYGESTFICLTVGHGEQSRRVDFHSENLERFRLKAKKLVEKFAIDKFNQEQKSQKESCINHPLENAILELM